MAHDWRKKFSIPVIGLTGSSGKTTAKEMIASILGLKKKYPEDGRESEQPDRIAADDIPPDGSA